MDGYRKGSGWTWHEGSVQPMGHALAFVLSASALVSLAYSCALVGRATNTKDRRNLYATEESSNEDKVSA